MERARARPERENGSAPSFPATKRTTLRNAAPLKFETIDFPSPVKSLKENDVYFVTSSFHVARDKKCCRYTYTVPTKMDFCDVLPGGCPEEIAETCVGGLSLFERETESG